jgi:hypothetical protein
MRELSTVELTVDLPSEGLSAGTTGVIVDVYSDPPGYEVEFVDRDGRTVALLALEPHQVRPARHWLGRRQ